MLQDSQVDAEYPHVDVQTMTAISKQTRVPNGFENGALFLVFLACWLSLGTTLVENPVMEPKCAKLEPKWSKMEPKGCQKRPKWSQRGARSDQSGAKGEPKSTKSDQKGAKMEPKGDQNAYKNQCSEKVAKRVLQGGSP